jgi:hypothetical protein
MKYIILGISLLALVAQMALVGGCSSERDPGPAPTTRVAEPSDVIGEDLMIALGQAKNHHRKAKVYMADGNVAAAIASIRQVLSLQFPRAAPEADDIRNDARALLAKLLVSQGQLDEAARTIDEGLAQSQRESFFVANLYTVQGEINEARAAAFDATGEASQPSATAERRAAIDSYDKSIRINEQLQKKLLEDR